MIASFTRSLVAIAALTALAAFAPSALAMSVVTTGYSNYGLGSSTSTTMNVVVPATAAVGDGFLFVSAQGDYAGSGKFLRVDLEGFHSSTASTGASGLGTSHAIHGITPVSHVTLEQVFQIPNAMLNDILANGSIDFTFTHGPNVALTDCSPFMAAVMFQAVPEPGTLMLLGVAGGAGLLCLARRRKSALSS